MATVIAIHRVTTSDPTAEMEHLGYDDEGNAIVNKVSVSHLPGDWFEYGGPDLEHLLEMEAIRYPTETEKVLREAGFQASGAAV